MKEVLLNKEQLKRFVEETRYTNVIKVDISNDKVWKVTFKYEHRLYFKLQTKTDSLIWNNLPGDAIKKEYILTGVRRILDWVGNSCVDRTNDKEWLATHLLPSDDELPEEEVVA